VDHLATSIDVKEYLRTFARRHIATVTEPISSGCGG
jgi:hypothetical protein